MQRAIRMFRVVVTGWVFLLAFAAFADQPTHSPGASATPQGLRFITRFDGRVTVGAAAERRRTVHVVIRDWFIPKAHVISQFPESGPVLVELVSGTASTVIGG